jgi:hypothetical protein
LQEWRNDQWSDTLKALHWEDQSLWRMKKGVIRVTTLSFPLGGIPLLDSEKAEALAESIEAQFQPVNEPSDPAVIETVDEALRAQSCAPASKPMLTNPVEVQKAIRRLKVRKAPDGIPTRALKHLPQRMILLLVALFNAILQTQHFSPVWKHARVISNLKLGNDPALPSSYGPISLLDTIGKVFKEILITKILSEVRGRRLLRDEQFEFRPKHSTSLQLARLSATVSRNFGGKRLTGAVILEWPRQSTPCGLMAFSHVSSTCHLTWRYHLILPARSDVRSVLLS